MWWNLSFCWQCQAVNSLGMQSDTNLPFVNTFFRIQIGLQNLIKNFDCSNRSQVQNDIWIWNNYFQMGFGSILQKYYFFAYVRKLYEIFGESPLYSYLIHRSRVIHIHSRFVKEIHQNRYWKCLNTSENKSNEWLQPLAVCQKSWFSINNNRIRTHSMEKYCAMKIHSS